MKNHFLYLTYSVLVLLFFTAIYNYLIPEKSNITAETRLRDSISEQKFKQDALKEYHKKINERVKKELNAITIANETSILLLSETIKSTNGKSQEVKNVYDLKHIQDSIHTKKVTALIDKYGWLGVDKIGAQNNYTLYAVMQNADIKIQGKYLTIMEQAVKTGTLAPEHYATLVDRKATIEHHQQIFGTQIANDKKTGKNKFVKIIKEELVNQRRKEIGLTPIETYAKQNNVEYDIIKSNS